MITFMLVLTLCQPGAASGCSNGLKIERIEHIPSKEACMETLKEFEKHRKFVNGTCVPQEDQKK